MPGGDIPGLYGKLPARGDFLSRRLDAEFIAGWDEWLQRAMRESREMLGGRWLECFLSAPVWRFVLPAGMYSKPGWVGLMVPSVDRVGRYFPLTLAAPLHQQTIDFAATLAGALGWLDALEALALEALTPELDFDAFDQRLAALAPPAAVPAAASPSDDTVPLGAAQPTFQVWELAPAAVDSVTTVLTEPPRELRAASALWFTRGGETLPPCIAACAGPIPGDRFCALLDGRWSEHAWTVVSASSLILKSQSGATESAMYCTPQNPGVDLIHGQGRGQSDAGPLTAPPGSANGAGT
ncbi:MAG TPA: type VI secretion system-associated protein TagF [Burkholderiales bacterium]|nr:type VI secretion system-associated protein TagF [Burkholderiales bacterium]